MFEVAAYTTEGVRKKVNQDAYCILTAESAWGPVAFVVVCDGVGGLSAGEMASSTVVSRFARWFEEEFPGYARFNSQGEGVELSSLKGVWTQLLGNLNSRIFAYGKATGIRLGTTFSGLLVCQGRFFIGHVGDCRVYRLSNGRIDVLTNDQTLVARELARGNITAEEAAHHPKQNVLLQAVGTQEGVKPEFYEGEVSSADQFLVCCDGFYRRLPAEVMREALSAAHLSGEEALGRVCEKLVQQCIANGETDNITTVYLGMIGESRQLAAALPADADAATTLLEEEDLTTMLEEEGASLGSDADELTTMLDQAGEGGVAPASGQLDEEDLAATFGQPVEDEPATASDQSDEDEPATMLSQSEEDEPTTMLDRSDEDEPTTMLDQQAAREGGVD